MNLALVGAAGVAALLFIGGRKRIVARSRPIPQPINLPSVQDTSEPDEIVSLLEEFVSVEPLPGHFYVVRYGDTIDNVVVRALETLHPSPTRDQRLQYIYCVSSGPRWNQQLYGTPSTTRSFPKEWLVPVQGIGLRVAFLARNQDALALVERGIMPSMSVDPKTGRPLGDEHGYGMIWLPPVDPTELATGGAPSCAPYSWEDGSSTIDPPPALLNLLERAKT